MKNMFRVIIAVLLQATLVSCGDFLDESPQSDFTAQAGDGAVPIGPGVGHPRQLGDSGGGQLVGEGVGVDVNYHANKTFRLR